MPEALAVPGPDGSNPARERDVLRSNSLSLWEPVALRPDGDALGAAKFVGYTDHTTTQHHADRLPNGRIRGRIGSAMGPR